MAVLQQGRQAAVRRALNLPPHSYFLVSAVFHYLGPAFAVLLFQRVDVLGVAWFRIAAAAVVFAIWRRPWSQLLGPRRSRLSTLLTLGFVLAAMNCTFYLAIDRLPLGTVGAIEFLGPICLAAAGVRTTRNLLALALAVGGVFFVTDVRIAGELLGFIFAFANCALFVLYVVLGHRIARHGGTAGVDRLGAAMLIAAMAVTPIGLTGALPAFNQPLLVGAGIAVGICSSVIPVRLRPAGHGATAPVHVRPPALAASGNGDRHRRAGAGPVPDPDRDGGDRAGHRRRRPPPRGPK